MGNTKNGYCLAVSVFFITIAFCWWVCCSYANPTCNKNNYTEGTQLAKNIDILLDTLGKASRAAAFNMLVVGEGKNRVYGVFQCRGDRTAAECFHCSRNALKNIQQECIHSAGSAVRYNYTCFMRFERYNFSRRHPLLHDTSYPPCTLAGGSGTHHQLALILGTTLNLVFVLIIFLCFLVVRRRKRTTIHRQRGDSCTYEEELLTYVGSLIDFRADMIKIATKDFQEDLKLGEGGFGIVYKGTLPNGKNVAVKKLSSKSGQGKNEFTNEMKLLVNIQHKNLVNLLGRCVEGYYQILVYEYLSNGSLDKIIFDVNKKVCLNWPQRFNIILGVAKGLLYLHEDSKLKIIHRDIKASNILLDDHFNPKISDFGLAKLSSEAETQVQTTVAGTCGYIAPEYGMQGQLSTKVDVYSFGVLVLEIIKGKKITDIDQCQESILEEEWKSFQQGNVLSLIDDSIASTCEHEQVSRCIHLGLLCVQSDPCLRPSMSTVVLMLSSNSIPLPKPTLPAFLYLNSNLGDASSGSKSHACSQGNESSILSLPR